MSVLIILLNGQNEQNGWFSNIKVISYRSLDIEARNRRNSIILHLIFNFIEYELQLDTSNMI
jgi:hypothetical protein